MEVRYNILPMYGSYCFNFWGLGGQPVLSLSTRELTARAACPLVDVWNDFGTEYTQLKLICEQI